MNAAVFMPSPAAALGIAELVGAAPGAAWPLAPSPAAGAGPDDVEAALFETLWRAALAAVGAAPSGAAAPEDASAAGAGTDEAVVAPDGAPPPARSGEGAASAPGAFETRQTVPAAARETERGKPGIEDRPAPPPVGFRDYGALPAIAAAGLAAARRAASVVAGQRPARTAGSRAPAVPSPHAGAASSSAVPGPAVGTTFEGGPPLRPPRPAPDAAGNRGVAAPGELPQRGESSAADPGGGADSPLSFAARLKTAADAASRGTSSRVSADEAHNGRRNGAGEDAETLRAEAEPPGPARAGKAGANRSGPEGGSAEAAPLGQARGSGAASGLQAPAAHTAATVDAGRAAPAPPPAQRAAEAADAAMPEPVPDKTFLAEPVRRLDLQLGQPGEVRLQVVERGGEIHVAVRSGRSKLAAALRDDLGALVQRVHAEGFRVEMWTPPEAGRRDGGHGEGSAGGRHGGGSGDAPPDSGGQDGRHQRREPPAWLEALEREAGGALTEIEEVSEWFHHHSR